MPRLVRLIAGALAAGVGAWIGALATGAAEGSVVPTKWQLVLATATGLYAVFKDIVSSLSEPPG